MRRLALRTAAALAALLLAAALAEVLVRRLDLLGISYYGDVQRYLREAVEAAPPEEVSPDGRIFQNRGGVDLELRTFRYRTDERGLRTGTARREPPEDAARILFVGDSVTLGWGVDDEETWVRLVERDGRAADGRALRCLNAGHLMYDTVQEASLLSAWGPELEPDLVLLTFVFNDLQPTYDQVLAMLADPDRPTGDGGIDEALAGRSFRWNESPLLRPFRGLRAVARFLLERRRVEREGRESFPPFTYYPSGWPRCEAALDRVLETSRELGAELVVLDHADPEIPELARWCEARGVPRIDTNFTAEERALPIRNSAIDTHANAQGHRLIADRALAGLRRAGVLADP